MTGIAVRRRGAVLRGRLDEEPRMNHLEFNSTGVGGLPLFAQRWLPDCRPASVVVISHGLGEHGGRYRLLAERLQAHRHAVYVLDHRGHGRSGGPRANIERFAHVVDDFCAFVGRSADETPGVPVFVIGHSMGGAIALAGAIRMQDSLRGLVLSAPALAAGEAVSPVKLALVRLLSIVAPGVGALQLPPAAVSRDPQVVRAYESDPLVFHKSVPARTVLELLQAMQGFPDSVRQLRLPVLVQHGTADILVPLSATRQLYQELGSMDRTVKTYDGLYHEIYNEPERVVVIDDLCRWLDAHNAG
jgi:alpha-beta hydrolase superfamily lysophospholipase